MHIDIDLSDCNHGDEADELIASTKLELAKSVKIFNYNYYYISPIKIPIDFPNGLEKISIEFRLYLWKPVNAKFEILKINN